MQITIYSDAGHAWAEVEKALCAGINISRYSYEKDGLAYLEEDCDLAKLCAKLKSEGVDFQFDEIHQGDHSPIRNYNQFRN